MFVKDSTNRANSLQKVFYYNREVTVRLGKDLIGKPIYSITNGKHLGTLKDLYIDLDLSVVNGLYLGSEGLIKRKSFIIQRENISLFGLDVILAAGPDVVVDSNQMPSVEGWLRRESLQGKGVDTPGGTKVGAIGDVLLDNQARIVGYSLSKVHVAGPVAEHRQVLNDAVLDIKSGESAMTIDLAKAEQPISVLEAPVSDEISPVENVERGDLEGNDVNSEDEISEDS
jgi:uncharacterized protein YrrD